jgi:hypothetical protein
MDENKIYEIVRILMDAEDITFTVAQMFQKN